MKDDSTPKPIITLAPENPTVEKSDEHAAAGSSKWDAYDVSQNFDEQFSAKSVQVSYELRSPTKTEWIRVHPDWRTTMKTLIDKSNYKSVWILGPSVVPLTPAHLVSARLFRPVITSLGGIFLWPLRPPRVGVDEWARTALVIADEAVTTWVQVFIPDEGASAYHYRPATWEMPEPEWPSTLTWEVLRDQAFGPREITGVEHPKFQAVVFGKKA
jgi:hypothetical protein